MQINKFFLVLFMLLVGCLSSATVYAENNPTVLLESIANKMISELKANEVTLKSNPAFVYRLANTIVVPHANLTEMSKRVLPPAIWNQASSAERVQFQKEFTRLLVRTYASALASYKNQSVRFYPIRGGYQGKRTVEVSSEIINGNSIHVVYRLINIGGQWQLFDMSVEGVSLIESFRSQFADILSQGNMSLLLKRLAEHSQRIKRS